MRKKNGFPRGNTFDFINKIVEIIVAYPHVALLEIIDRCYLIG
jgi:hypothetical protein